MKILLTTSVDGSVTQVFSRFDINLFKALTPKVMHKKMLRFDGCQKGDRFTIQTLTGAWNGLITERVEAVEECYFIDEGEKLPFPLVFWRHRHIVRKIHDSTCIVDDIEFKTHLGLIDMCLYPGLWLFFKARAPVYRRYFKETV